MAFGYARARRPEADEGRRPLPPPFTAALLPDSESRSDDAAADDFIHHHGEHCACHLRGE